MTGKQIKTVLEDAIDFYLNPSGSWGAYPKSSGLRFDVNEAKDYGSRVSNLEVNPKLAGTWTAIEMSKTYTVVTNNFIATPRDGYNEFGNIPDEKRVDTFVEYAQSFIEYSKSVGVLEPVPTERASTQNWTDKLTFTVANEYGCLTAWSFDDKVKVRPCKGYRNQAWTFVNGNIKSVKHGTCLKKDRINLTHRECDEKGPAFIYNLFDKSLFLEGNSKMVVGARYWLPGDHVKFFARDEKASGQDWKIDFL